jgi:hypothetical protein
LCVTLAIWSAGVARDHLARRADLSAGKPWVASSEYGEVCHSPERRCTWLKSYFFHTREEQGPWLELDLLREQQISRVQVINRKDCCTERVAPLVLEVSSDRTHFREVMRKNEAFEEWQARFAPVRARWVRLRVARRSFLHLADVRVLE